MIINQVPDFTCFKLEKETKDKQCGWKIMKTGFCPFAENPVTDETLRKLVLCLLQSAVDALSTGQVQYSQNHSAVFHQ